MNKYNDGKSDNFMEPTVSQYGSHMVMTNVHKPIKTKYVNIDTIFADEYNLNTTADYNITLPEKITNVQSVSISNIDLPMSFYNISSDLGNNVFSINYNSENFTIEIPNGQYDSIENLKNAINTSLTKYTQIADPESEVGYTDMFFSVNNNTVTFRSFLVYPFTINFDTNSIGTDRYNFKSKLGWLLGFRKPCYIVPAGGENGTTYVSAESIYNFNTIRYMYLVIDEFSRGNQNTFISPLPSSLINKNIIAKISLNSTEYPFDSGKLHPFNSIMTLNRYNGLMSDRRTYSGKIDLQKLNIKLINEYGKPIHFNGNHFSFCMEITHE
jgi:hypothetical protein